MRLKTPIVTSRRLKDREAEHQTVSLSTSFHKNDESRKENENSEHEWIARRTFFSLSMNPFWMRNGTYIVSTEGQTSDAEINTMNCIVQ